MDNEGIAKLTDTRSISQVLAAIIKDPNLIDEYTFSNEDFVERFYVLLYRTVLNLYQSGVSEIDELSIDSYLSGYEAQYEVFNEHNGLEFVNKILMLYQPDNFQYYYQRVKKFSLLRYWKESGYDITKIYDYTISSPEEQEKQMMKFDSYNVDDMIDIMDNMMINEAKLRFSSNTNHKGQLAGKGLKSLKESFKQAPDYGVPLQSEMMNTVSRGCRLGKFFLRSGDQGSGKSRTGIADMVNIAVPHKYDWKKKEWIHTGVCEPALIISTELEFDEVMPIILAYVSGVSEEKIRDASYSEAQEAVIDKAIEYIEDSPLYIENIPDFGIKDIEQIIKKYKREKGVLYFFFDYIHMSNKLIMEVATMSKGMRLREDQILFLFSDTLKNLCNKLGIFILSSTQLNGTYKDSVEKDATMLRGAKSLADRIDLGEISLAPSMQELKVITDIVRRTPKLIGCKTPNLIRHVYKLRGGKWSKIKIVQHADLGTCRTTDLFALGRDNKLIDIPLMSMGEMTKDSIKEIESIVNSNSDDLSMMPEEYRLEDLVKIEETGEYVDVSTGEIVDISGNNDETEISNESEVKDEQDLQDNIVDLNIIKNNDSKSSSDRKESHARDEPVKEDKKDDKKDDNVVHEIEVRNKDETESFAAYKKKKSTTLIF